MSVTSAYIECATGKRYHSIELANSFRLKYRYWTLAKITASALWKKFSVRHRYYCYLMSLELSYSWHCTIVFLWWTNTDHWWLTRTSVATTSSFWNFVLPKIRTLKAEIFSGSHAHHPTIPSSKQTNTALLRCIFWTTLREPEWLS